MLVAVAGILAHPAPSNAQVTWNSVTLSWTTPGDDSLSGRASSFDLRYSTSPISAANFAAALRWNSMPAPAVSGASQSVTVTGLTSNTTYYFAIKTADEVPNWSGISNLVSRTTSTAPDLVRPAPLGIAVNTVNDTSATLGWDAVGDDSLTGQATAYDVRYSTSPITNSNWNSAQQAVGEPAPAVSGAAQTFVVRGLSRQVTYYFAAKVTDEAGNTSALSNVPSVTTTDTVPPAAITNLSAGFVWFGWHSADAVRPAAYGRVRP
jgi:chitodextrinase